MEWKRFLKTYADMFTIIFSMAAGITMFMIIVAHMSGLVMGAVDGSSAIAYAKKVSICLHLLYACTDIVKLKFNH